MTAPMSRRTVLAAGGALSAGGGDEHDLDRLGSAAPPLTDQELEQMRQRWIDIMTGRQLIDPDLDVFAHLDDEYWPTSGPDDPDDFAVALRYSPLHNVTEGTEYPATLVITGDHDDRVVPLHSHKFTATLQRAQAGTAPILTRIEVDTGHGMGKPISKVAAESADMLAFAAHHLGMVLSD